MQEFLGKLGRMFSTSGGDAQSNAEEQVQIAAAALMIHAMRIDDEVRPDEYARVKTVLKGRFEIDGNELDTLITQGTAEDDDAVDLYRFTKILTANLDQRSRQQIVRMLWEVVVADGRIDEFESNLVWRVAELLGVSTENRIRLRQDVLSELD
jgi:uncharacterized tellurite resistance protein B-like protein